MYATDKVVPVAQAKMMADAMRSMEGWRKLLNLRARDMDEWGKSHFTLVV